MSFGVIGGADGPTAVLVAEEVGFDWINIFGMFIVILMLIPNVIYAVKFRGKRNKCTYNALNILEHISQYACILFMIFSIGKKSLGFPSVGNFLVYGLGNGALLLVYWIIWVLFFIKQDKWKKMTLAVIPACIFLLSGWMLEQWALVISAIAFCVAHIYVTKENMK